MLTVGKELTVTVVVLVAMVAHPDKFPLTVYTVVAVGVTTIEAALELVFQVYVVIPDAVSIADEPGQTVAAFIAILGAEPTVTDVVAVFTQPAAELPVTV